MSLFNDLNPGNAVSAEGRPLLSPLLQLDTPEIGPRGATAPFLYDKEMISPSKTWQDTQFDQGTSYPEQVYSL